MNEGAQDKVQGKFKEVGGKVQQAAGNVLGDEELKGQGEANEVEGKGQGLLGNAKDALGKAADHVKGFAENLTDHNKTSDTDRTA